MLNVYYKNIVKVPTISVLHFIILDNRTRNDSNLYSYTSAYLLNLTIYSYHAEYIYPAVIYAFYAFNSIQNRGAGNHSVVYTFIA